MNLPKFDVIVTWPRNADYPLWRKFIRDNRHKFNDVFIVFMEPNTGYNYMPSVVTAMSDDKVTSILSPEIKKDEDWRDVAVNHALKYSRAEWVWFTEQDFYPTNKFWVEAETAYNNGCEVIGVMDGNRLHPCSLMVKRELLEKTSKNFGIKAGYSDHFGAVQRELAHLEARITIIDDNKYKHYAGMSHNWRLISENQAPNYKAGEFVDYLQKSLKCGVELSSEWRSIAQRAITALLPQNTRSPLLSPTEQKTKLPG